MKKQPSPISFDDAYDQLLQMVKQIENDNVSLKDLASKIKEAKSLVKTCENQLRQIEQDSNEDAEHKQ